VRTVGAKNGHSFLWEQLAPNRHVPDSRLTGVGRKKYKRQYY